MVALVLNVALATWLFVSAFVLPQSAATAWNTLILSVLVATIAFSAFSAPGRPGMRYHRKRGGSPAAPAHAGA